MKSSPSISLSHFILRTLCSPRVSLTFSLIYPLVPFCVPLSFYCHSGCLLGANWYLCCGSKPSTAQPRDLKGNLFSPQRDKSCWRDYISFAAVITGSLAVLIQWLWIALVSLPAFVSACHLFIEKTAEWYKRREGSSNYLTQGLPQKTLNLRLIFISFSVKYSLVLAIFIPLGLLYFPFLSYFHLLLLFPTIMVPETFSFDLPFRLYLLSPPSACCRWHCEFPGQVEQCTSPPSFCLSGLTSSGDRPLAPLISPPPSPLLPSLVSSLPTVSTVVTGASHSHSASFLTTSGPFPRAPIWSPWRLKGCSKASSCCVKVKVFHQRILPLCPFPSLVSELLLAVCTKDAYSFIFFFPFSPPCPTCSIQRNIFLRSAYQSTAAVVLNFHCTQRSDFIPLLASIMINPFISWWHLMDAGADRYWSLLRR